jgi:hypothetical protein
MDANNTDHYPLVAPFVNPVANPEPEQPTFPTEYAIIIIVIIAVAVVIGAVSYSLRKRKR